MAKWGQGDPRWIVEERPDATNVNNWHWTEKNASQWSKEKIKELFTNLVIENDIGTCRISDVSKIEGEASANNRKAKLIFFYEWSIKMEWKGSVKGCDEQIKGKIEIPNLSEENDPSDVDFNVTSKNNSQEAEKLKELIRTKGAELLRKKVAEYIRDLKEEFSVGMILPQKDGGNINDIIEKTPEKSEKNRTVQSKVAQSKSSEFGLKNLNISGVKIHTTSLNLKETFKCTAEEFYNALTIKEMVQAFTHGPCKMELHKGGKFELFGGNVSGEFMTLVPSKKLEMKWRFSGWPAGHYSNVTLNIHQKEDSTEVTLAHTGIPVNDLERTKSGWNHYYWESMKKTFGFGAMLF